MANSKRFEKVPPQLRESAAKLVEGSSQGLGTTYQSGKKPICAVFPDHIKEILCQMPNRSAYVREAVMEKLRREGWLDDVKS